MAVEFLVHARSYKIYKAGAISQTVKESPAVWGRKETLPDFIRVTVTDATKEDIAKYNQQWVEKFIVKDSPSAIIIERVDQGRINRINISDEKLAKVKLAFKELGLRRSDISLVDGDIHISKAGRNVTIDDVQSIVSDVMEGLHRHRRFHIKTSIIDNLVANNRADVQVTLSQLEANLVDGLD